MFEVSGTGLCKWHCKHKLTLDIWAVIIVILYASHAYSSSAKEGKQGTGMEEGGGGRMRIRREWVVISGSHVLIGDSLREETVSEPGSAGSKTSTQQGETRLWLGCCLYLFCFSFLGMRTEYRECITYVSDLAP